MPSAIEQAIDAFRTRFEAAGLNVEDHRDESQMLQREELDVVALSFGGAPVVMLDNGGEYMLKAQIIGDFYGVMKPGVPILSACCALINIAMAVVQAANVTDNWGELFHDCRPESVSELTKGAESGVMSVVFDVEYRVAKGDWSQILTD